MPTPGTSQGAEYHPVIVNPSGIPEGYAPVTEESKTFAAAPQPVQAYALQTGHDPHYHPKSYPPQPQGHDMGRLEALVAVATSENRAAEHRS